MKQILKMAVAPVALLAFALVGTTTSVEAGSGDYCRTDVTSGMRSCGFATMEQCQAMSSGRGGGCFRDPFLEDSSAYAYQPKNGKRRITKPIENR